MDKRKLHQLLHRAPCLYNNIIIEPTYSEHRTRGHYILLCCTLKLL